MVVHTALTRARPEVVDDRELGRAHARLGRMAAARVEVERRVAAAPAPHRELRRQRQQVGFPASLQIRGHHRQGRFPLERIETEIPTEHTLYLVKFIRASKRGIGREMRDHGSSMAD